MANKKKPIAVEEEVTKVIATVKGGNLNIRGDRSTDNPPVGVLHDGEKVEVLTQGKMWCKIAGGYVMTKFLEF